MLFLSRLNQGMKILNGNSIPACFFIIRYIFNIFIFFYSFLNESLMQLSNRVLFYHEFILYYKSVNEAKSMMG